MPAYRLVLLKQRTESYLVCSLFRAIVIARRAVVHAKCAVINRRVYL